MKKALGMILFLTACSAWAQAPTPREKCLYQRTNCPGKGWVTTSCDDPNPCGISAPSSSGRRSGGGGISAPSGGGLDATQQMSLQLMQGFMTELMRSDPEADARRAEAARQAEILRKQREEEERIAAEKRHRELSANMHGIETNSGGLALKVGGHDSGLKLKTGDEGFGSSTPQLLRTEDSNHLAKGDRIVDCDQSRATRDRLVSGAPAQLETINKTEKQLQAAKENSAKMSKEAKRQLTSGMVDEAKDYALSSASQVDKVKKAVDKLKLQGKLSPDKIAKWSDYASKLDEGVDAMGKLKQSGQAGFDYGKNLQKPVSSFSERAAEANQFLVDSGIAEEVGEKLATTGFGPLGGLAFRGAKLSIDVGVSAGESYLSAEEAAVAQRNLDTMRDQYKRTQDRVQELNQDLTEKCQGP